MPSPSLALKALTAEPPEPVECLHRGFEAQAARTPDALAVLFETESLTYSALNSRANRVAHHLRKRGIGPEALVGICAHRSLEMVVGLLGILKAGAAYLPLDPDYPTERLTFMLEDSRARVLLTQEALRDRMPAFEGLTLCLDGIESPFSGEHEDDLPGGAGPDDLAYVIYTSGSTGRPKGVEITHRGICSNLKWRQETFPLTAQDRLLQTYSFSFDPSVWAFFWPLICGAGIVLPRPGGQGDPSYLIDLIERRHISVLGFSPSLLSVLLDHPRIARCRSLRHVFSGGEPLTADLQRRFFAHLDASLHNVYGPTEATIDAAWWSCHRDADDETIPIGYPLPRTRLYVLGEDGRRVSPGCPGELHIAGVGLARGYLGRAALTAEKFLPNPFAADDFPALYRTGDLCRQRPDGAVEYLGRIDQQVKVRGFRIELGEIEAALARHPDVRDVAVLAQEDGSGSKRLVAYVVPKNYSLSRHGLRNHIAAELPDHMVPSAFVLLTALPLSPNGKLDRNALPLPSEEDYGRDDAVTAPQTPLQRQLVTIWEKLLGVSPIGIDEDFFELGGHSLLAARLVGEMEQISGRTLSPTLLRSGATVERIASLLEQPEVEEQELPLLQRWSRGAERPLFFLHGDFMGGFYCGPLARHLGTTAPLYALLPHGANGSPLLPTIEAMAADHIATIQAVQPQGPYRLGGFCNGALVAYEIARQLREQGQEIELLALIEMRVPATLVKLSLHRLACHIGHLLGLDVSGLQAVSLGMQRSLTPFLMMAKTVRGRWEQWMRACGRLSGPDWSMLIPEKYRNAAVRYHLRPYDGRLTLLDAREGVGRFATASMIGWDDLASESVYDTIPGNHFTSTMEHLPDLAKRLQTYLRAADSGTSTGD